MICMELEKEEAAAEEAKAVQKKERRSDKTGLEESKTKQGKKRALKKTRRIPVIVEPMPQGPRRRNTDDVSEVSGSSSTDSCGRRLLHQGDSASWLRTSTKINALARLRRDMMHASECATDFDVLRGPGISFTYDFTQRAERAPIKYKHYHGLDREEAFSSKTHFRYRANHFSFAHLSSMAFRHSQTVNAPSPRRPSSSSDTHDARQPASQPRGRKRSLSDGDLSAMQVALAHAQMCTAGGTETKKKPFFSIKLPSFFWRQNCNRLWENRAQKDG